MLALARKKIKNTIQKVYSESLFKRHAETVVDT